MNTDPVLAQLRYETGDLAIHWTIADKPADGFRIARDGQTWHIDAANPRSALWALRHVRRGGGVGEHRPRFAIRGVNLCESLARHTPEQVERFIERMADWRMNRLIVHPQYGWREHGPRVEQACAARGIEIVHYLYTTIAFASDAPPQLLAQGEDGRPRTPHVACETRLCASNPEARRLFRDGARRYFRQNVRDHQRILLATADGLLLCQCPGCHNLSAIQQWQPFLEIAVDEAHAVARGLQVEFLSYILRFALPERMDVFNRIDSVMFDLHWRYRWAALGEDHPATLLSPLQATGDPRSEGQPNNRYLLDRLRDWRAAFSRPLYVFENLMLQGSMSCPQPNTPWLLSDLETFEREGVDGIVYEAFEPGIDSFRRQLDCLSSALWKEASQVPPVSSPAESPRGDQKDRRWGHRRHLADPGLDWAPPPDRTARRLPILMEYPEELERAAVGPDQSDPLLREYLQRLTRFMADKSHINYRRTAEYVLDHPERFDGLYIATLMAKLSHAEHPWPFEADRHVLAYQLVNTTKLWDFMEAQFNAGKDPRLAVQQAVRQLFDLVH